MYSARKLAITFSVFCILALVPSFAAAELEVNLYGGVASPEKDKVTVKGYYGGFSAEASDNVKYKDGAEFGGRLTYWFTDPSINANWFGMALDVSYFQTEAKTYGADIWVVPVSGLIMLRYPGRFLQPYVGVGGGFYISHFKQNVDLTAYGLGNQTFSDTKVNAGFDARAGLQIRLFKGFGIFGEGRYTYFSPEYDDNILGAEVKVKTDSEVYHALVGIAYHF